MWLVVNDIIMGFALGTFLVDNHQALGAWMEWLIDYFTIDLIKATTMWLMGWPAGLKLNDKLDRFIGEMFLWLIAMWSAVL